MQVSTETTGPLERQLRVEVPETAIEGQVRERLLSLSKTTRLDGFRPGKVPIKLLERRFGSRVRQEVVGEMLRSSLQEALEAEQLRIAGQPTIDPVEDEPGQGLKYTATVEILPEVSLSPVDELVVAKPVCQVTEEDLDKMVQTLREQNRVWEPVDRAASQGDQLMVDYQGTVDGEVFEGGTAEDFPLELGSKRFLDGFEDGLLGAEAGERRTLDLRFPDDYGRAQLAGKPAQFEVTVKTVAESRLPALDEEFFAKFGVSEGGSAAFRDEVRANLDRELQQALRQRTKERVFDALYAANPLDLPEKLVAGETERLRQETRQRLVMQGIPEERLADMDDAEFRSSAEKRVALGLLMAEIVKQGGLRADPGEVRNRVQSIAASYEDPNAVIKWYYEEPGRLSSIESSVLEQSVVDWLLERAKVTEAAVEFDDIMNPGQTDSSD